MLVEKIRVVVGQLRIVMQHINELAATHGLVWVRAKDTTMHTSKSERRCARAPLALSSTLPDQARAARRQEWWFHIEAG